MDKQLLKRLKEAEKRIVDLYKKVLTLTTNVPTPFTPSYKVFTALLTQNGVTDVFNTDNGELVIGTTYYINQTSLGMDFTNVGAPNNEVGTYFIATNTSPNSWGENELLGYDTLTWDAGAPVATILENTIGNVWFTYEDIGYYKIYDSNNSFITVKHLYKMD